MVEFLLGLLVKVWMVKKDSQNEIWVSFLDFSSGDGLTCIKGKEDEGVGALT